MPSTFSTALTWTPRRFRAKKADYNVLADWLMATDMIDSKKSRLLSESLQAFRDSHAIFDRLAKSEPGNAGWQRDLSMSYDTIGDVLVAQGNLPEALQSFRAGLDIRERLAKSEPDNAGWQRDLIVSYRKLAEIDQTGARTC